MCQWIWNQLCPRSAGDWDVNSYLSRVSQRIQVWKRVWLSGERKEWQPWFPLRTLKTPVLWSLLFLCRPRFSVADNRICSGRGGFPESCEGVYRPAVHTRDPGWGRNSRSQQNPQPQYLLFWPRSHYRCCLPFSAHRIQRYPSSGRSRLNQTLFSLQEGLISCSCCLPLLIVPLWFQMGASVQWHPRQIWNRRIKRFLPTLLSGHQPLQFRKRPAIGVKCASLRYSKKLSSC